MLRIRPVLFSLATFWIASVLPAKADSVNVVPAATVHLDQVLTLDARVEAIHQTTLAAQTGGQIQAVHVDVGDIVPAGTVLLEINDRNQRAELESAEAALKAAEAALADAQKALKRARALFQRKLASQQDLDNAQARYDVAQAQAEGARARLDAAREQLRYTRPKAPYSGIVLERHVNLGQVVAPGTPLLTGTSLDQLRVVTEIPQNDMPKVRQWQSATVYLPDGTQIPRAGDSMKFFAWARPETATFRVRLNLPEKLPGLYPGMLLKTSFKIGERDALTIPASAVVARAELCAVYVQDGQGNLRFRQIHTGRTLPGDRIEVLAGLEAGERVVIDPAHAIARRTIGANGASHE